MSDTLIKGATVRVRTGRTGRPFHGTVKHLYVSGDVKVQITSTGQTLRVSAESVTVL